ncbi:MAG TPA: MBL fold metallo-hydrolase [Solirubrobacteraceae bacterium]|jgi:glyoxylase-like metal-dependent hydrolase (beta-lactamase superfamily II)|nr:MBL fold metallo-hydrolase [Solirubrobacteraceae bacterium]
MPTSRRDQGRGERVLPGLWRLRLPLPWPGIPHCNAWAIASDGGFVLIDTGMYDDGSMAQLERALHQVKLDLADASLLAITHAHSDHWGQAAPIVERAGCEMWMHPNHGAQFANLADPDRALTRRMEVARHSGVPDGALTEYVKRAKDMPSGIAAALEPSRSLVDGVTIDTDLGRWDVIETPGHTPSHVCFYQPERRLLISGDHLLGRITLYFDYGQSEDPVGEYLASLSKVQAVRARLALSGHGKPFLDVPGHIDGTRRLVQDNIDRATAAVTSEPRTAMTIALDMFREQRGMRHPAWLLSQTLCYLRHLEHGGRAQREIDGELQFWRATGG